MADGLNKSELLREISDLIKDEFIAKVETKESSVVLSFLNGQKFKIELTEM